MDARLEKQFAEELDALEKSGEYLAFTMSPSEGWYLFSLLQVMWRHQEIAQLGDLGKFVRQFASQIQTRLCKTPAMAEVAQLGWEAKNDVPFPEPGVE